MGSGKKLRTWRAKHRDQLQSSPASQSSVASPPPASSAAASVLPSSAIAYASTSSSAPVPVAASGAAWQAPSQSQPTQSPPALASSLFPFMHLVEHPDAAKKSTPPRLVYVSLSSELHLLYADSQSSVPTSLVDFRGADVCISLTRMAYEPPQASSPPISLEAFVAPRVRPATHPSGPAVLITREKRSILLIAATEEERGALLSALRLCVAPWPILRQRMEAEMRDAAAPSASAPSLADAARELLSGAGGASGAGAGSESDAGGKEAAGVTRVVWEKAGSVAQTSLWGATFGQGLGGVVRTAEELEKLSKPLGGLTVVGCAFSLVALSARAVSLMGMERKGREMLVQAREDLHEASVSLVGWLCSILRSGFSDEDGLVGRVFDILGECWDGADELERYLMRRLPMRTWNADDVTVIVAKVKAVSDKLFAACLLKVVAGQRYLIADNRFDIEVLQSQTALKDDFCPYAPDPSAFDVGLVANAATSLPPLKAAVLPSFSTEGSAGVVDSNPSGSSSSLRRVGLTSINGEGGVGKTSTCKLLCVDEDVRAYFSEGAILFMEIGQGASEEKVVNEVRKAVSKCGGKRVAEEIRSASDIFEAVDIASKFFSERRMFIVVDNVWETPANSKVTSWAVTLAKIASFPGSAVVMTARSVLLSESSGFDRVHLGRLDLGVEGSPDWRIAEQLYDDLLDATPENRRTEIYLKDRKKAFKLTCGLPLGIKTFTGVVRSRLRFGDDVSSVLAKIEKRALGLAGKFVGEDMSAATGHPGLSAAMEESLVFLDEHKGCRVKSAPLAALRNAEGKNSRIFSASYLGLSNRPLSSRYAALEAMPVSSSSISLQVLCRLWHLENVEDAEEIALLFANVGLGRIAKDNLGQDKVLCLHDMQHEFCAGMRVACDGATADSSAARTSTVDGHALLLSSCESLLDAEKDWDAIGMGWASFCFAEGQGLPEAVLRRYLAQNLFRHLCAAIVVMDVDGVRRTVYSLLSDFRWLRGRMAGDGNAAAVSDCLFALASPSGAGPRLLTGGAEASVRALQESLMLVGDGVSLKSDGKLAGILFQLALPSVDSGDTGLDAALFLKLVDSTEENVLGAWLKPIRECHRARRAEGVLAQAVVGSGAKVWSIAALGNGAHFASGSADGAVRVHESDSLGAVLELKGHTDEVNCVCVSKEEGVDGSFLLFSGGDDCTIRSWEVDLDPVKGFVKGASVVVVDCESPVLCLSIAKRGDLVAAGCESGNVFICKRREGDADLSFGLATSFRCAGAGKEPGWVRGVAVSQSGGLVVAVEKKGCIAFWTREGTESEGTVNRCCASDESGSDLRHVLLSENESSVNFVFDEPAGCEIWDVASRTRCSPRVALSDFNVLSCATFSGGEEACAEGSGARGVLVAGGWDKSWNDFISLYATSGDFKVLSTYPLASPPRSVCCASFGGHKKLLVGSDDGCVRMLDASESVASRGAEPHERGARSLGSRGSEASGTPELELASTVAVMPTAGLVVAGHRDGRFSLWQEESGEFVRAFEDEGGDWVRCVDLSADERLAVSGHQNNVAFVWDASTWENRFGLEGHSRPVICATISADAKLIVTVDNGGELRLWDAEIGGAALLSIETGLKFSVYGSRGAISLDGGLFVFASKHEGDRKWRGKVIVTLGVVV